jgi:hypothetical protein
VTRRWLRGSWWATFEAGPRERGWYRFTLERGAQLPLPGRSSSPANASGPPSRSLSRQAR